MFTWIELALLLLKIVNAVMTRVNNDQLIQSGRDAEIAEVSAAVLKKTEVGKKMMEKINAMSDADVDAGLRDLLK